MLIFASKLFGKRMELLIILLLILLNGIFAMSEVALISARKSSLSSQAKKGSKSAARALRLADDPDRFLSTVQIGITLIGILTGIYSGAALADRFAGVLSEWGMPQRYAHPAAQTVIVVAVTYLTLIFGELVPKRIGLGAAERVARVVARPMKLLSVAASPFVWLLSKSTAGVSRLLGIERKSGRVTEEEIRSMVREGRADGEVREVEQKIVDRVFSLGDRTVESIMTHRSELVWLDADAVPAAIREAVDRDPHHRYPVAEGRIDRLLGVALLKDIFRRIDEPGFGLREIVAQPLYFHEDMDVYRALEELRRSQADYGMVIDEFGVPQGIVTLRDILEALVGMIPDAREEPYIVARDDGGVWVDGQCPFYDFLAWFEREDAYAACEYNTVSGLILDRLGHVPHTGEKVRWEGFLFEVVDMDGARIDKILVYPSPR